MTEKRFTKYVPDSYGYTYITTIIDNEKNKQTGNIDEIVDLLNELDEKYVDEFALRETLQQELQRVENENEELKKILKFLRNDNATDILNVLNSQENQIWELKKENEQLKHECNYLQNRLDDFVNIQNENEQLKKDCSNLIDDNTEYVAEINQMHKENEQLKQSYAQLKHRHSLLHDECLNAECDRDSYHKDVLSLEKENEQLKKDVDYWKQVASQYSNELNVFEHCKKYKTECKDIHWSSD